MSKETKINFRDLYKNKGKKLSTDDQESKNTVKEQLSSGVESLFSRTTISPILRDKILKLKITDPVVNIQNLEPRTLTFGANKSEIQMLLLSFGLNLQRILGSAIPNLQQLHEQFLFNFPQILNFSETECLETLKYLHTAGLIYQFTPEIIFEPLSQSKDINQLFSLIQSPENSIPIARIKNRFPQWSVQKIQNIIELLIENGLAIVDDQTIWFPQLT